jgi:hypothetical protein
MSSIDFNAVANRLTTTRLGSYLQATNDAVEPAIRLYDWNTSVSSALYEDLGRLEVVFRNAVDDALVRHGTSKAWPDVWYRRMQHDGSSLPHIDRRDHPGLVRRTGWEAERQLARSGRR